MNALTEKTVNYFVKEYQSKGELTEELLRELITRVHNQATQTRKKKLPEIVKEALTAENVLLERIESYNTVVRNTLRKLPAGSYSIPTIMKDSHLFQFTRLNPETGKDVVYGVENYLNGTHALQRNDVLIFAHTVHERQQGVDPQRARTVSKRVITRIPASHLWNDPVTVAQFVRKTVASELIENMAVFESQKKKDYDEKKGTLDSAFEAWEEAKTRSQVVAQKQEKVVQLRKARKAKRLSRKTETVN